MKLTRSSKRAVKAAHKNTKLLHSAPLRSGRLVALDSGGASYTFEHNAGERWGSLFVLELSRSDIEKLAAIALPRNLP